MGDEERRELTAMSADMWIVWSAVNIVVVLSYMTCRVKVEKRESRTFYAD